MQINLNDHVKIRIKPEGERIYREHYADVERTYGKSALPRVDAEGWTKLPLYVVMRIFGPHLGPGYHTPIEPVLEYLGPPGEVLP